MVEIRLAPDDALRLNEELAALVQRYVALDRADEGPSPEPRRAVCERAAGVRRLNRPDPTASIPWGATSVDADVVVVALLVDPWAVVGALEEQGDGRAREGRNRRLDGEPVEDALGA